ncbi:MAG: hypothetical protein WCJ83_03025 [Actinomycetes bacterium]
MPLSIVMVMIIDCDKCLKKDIECANCVVTFFIGVPEKSEISPRVHNAITLLASREITKDLKFESGDFGHQTG